MDKKELLEQILNDTPADNKHADLRFHLKRSISEVEKLQKRETRKLQNEQQSNQWKFDPKMGLVNPFVLKVIDEMIAVENQKIEDLKKKPNVIEKTYDGPING